MWGVQGQSTPLSLFLSQSLQSHPPRVLQCLITMKNFSNIKIISIDANTKVSVLINHSVPHYMPAVSLVPVSPFLPKCHTIMHCYSNGFWLWCITPELIDYMEFFQSMYGNVTCHCTICRLKEFPVPSKLKWIFPQHFWA
jgi:hypothetical protein